ncbi:MAG: type II toxin-antitoxin system Phd/YefM family antitoxin [Microbacterium sp.]
MAVYNILEARNNLSRLVVLAESGAEVTIMRRGKPVAKIVSADEPPPDLSIGEWLRANPLPPRLARPRGQLDEIIAENRGPEE